MNDLKKDLRLTSVQVHIDKQHGGKEPKTIVSRASKNIKSGYLNKRFDQVWCVFDDDNREEIDQVLSEAENNGVKVAFSNPCFELWYFLHYEYSTGACDQKQMLSRLKKYCTSYSKSNSLYHEVKGKTGDAVKNAKELRKHHVDSGNCDTANPSTNVDELIELLFSLQNPRNTNPSSC